MNYKKVLITGGAGFVGSNLALTLKNVHQSLQITVFDNLSRKGSELNLPRLKKHGIHFILADVRDRSSLTAIDTDLIIECSAEPSVMAGVHESPEYLVDTNLGGAINCFELARIRKADVIFLSTSRVYPVHALSTISYTETGTRYEIAKNQVQQGISKKGIEETFILSGVRSMYGATKLSAELLLQEYIQNYGIKAVISRFGLIAGPWQFGKVDQGVIALWVARHIYGRPLTYIGFNGSGKQVRDVVHVDDVWDAIYYQITHLSDLSGNIFNIGGGIENSISLLELTSLCQDVSGKTVQVKKDPSMREGDIPIYISDYTKFAHQASWRPRRSVVTVVSDVYNWIEAHKSDLSHVLA